MITIYLSKSDSTLSVDWDNMPDNAKAHIIEYGLRQKLNDAGSAATVKELGQDEAAAQAKAMAENVLDALMQGKVTVRQAAQSLTSEQRAYNKILKSIFKKLFKNAEFDADTALDLVAGELNKPTDEIKTKIEAKAVVEAETARKIAALKQATPDIEF